MGQDAHRPAYHPGFNGTPVGDFGASTQRLGVSDLVQAGLLPGLSHLISFSRPEALMSKKSILMLVGDYVEDYEVMVPFQALSMVGHTVHGVCAGKKSGEHVRTAIHDFEGDQTYSERRGHNFTLNATFDQVKPEDYDALVIPGGRAPEYIRLIPRIIQLVHNLSTANKTNPAIHHTPQILAAADLLHGTQYLLQPPARPQLTQAHRSYLNLP